MELNEELSKLEIEREIKEEAEKTQLKKCLSSWADSIPHHGLVNFGQQIEVLTIKSVPTYVATLKVQYEIRSLHEGTWPYQGKSIFPSRVQLNNKNEVWSVNLSSVDDFSKIIRNYSVSEKIFTCDGCGGHGKVYCSSCGGHGELTCSTCGGRARIVCSSCNGDGRVECNRCWGNGSIKGDSSINYREITCPSCGGQRFVFCSSCAGSGARDCPNCTNGKVVCSTCLGSGVLTCGNCRGAGQLIYCVYLKDKFTFREGLKSVHHDSVPTEIHSKITHRRRTADSIVKLSEQEIKNEAFGSINHRGVKHACENLLDQAKNIKEFGIYLRNYRILKEKMEIAKVKLAFIEYKFSEKIYQAWVYGYGVITKYQFEKENLDFSTLLPKLIEKGYVTEDCRVNSKFSLLDDEFKSWFPEYNDDQFCRIDNILLQRSSDNKVWAPVNPIYEFSENLFNNAQELFGQEEYSLALASIDKAIEMFDKNEYKKLREKIIKVINNQYLSGAIIGGTIFPIIGNISGIMIGFIFQNAFSTDIQTSKRRFFSAFWTSLVVNACLLLILSIILFVM